MGNSFNASKVIVSMVVVLSLGLLLFVVQPGRAGIVFNDRDPFAAILINNCDGSEISVEGVIHTLFKLEGKKGRDSLHVNATGKGENVDTGDKYVFQNSSNDQCFTDCGLDLDGTDVNLTVVDSFKLIGQGTAPNLVAQIRFRITGPPLEFELLHMNVHCQ